MNPSMHSSEKHDWETPAELLDRVRRVGAIAMDPCTTAANPTNATLIVHPPDDGLAVRWNHGLVYVNPPYGRALKAWASKIAAEANDGAEIIALTPSRTDTAWWHELWCARDCCCFVRGRLTFVGAPHPAPFPSCAWYFGTQRQRFVRAFGDLGIIC